MHGEARVQRSVERYCGDARTTNQSLRPVGENVPVPNFVRIGKRIAGDATATSLRLPTRWTLP
jgi:hypothetical protein